MKVLLILGHPRASSFGHALADAFSEGMREAGISWRRLDLRELDYVFDVTEPSPEDQFLEPVLRRAQEDIAWADHLVFIYPTWWGTAPARLKAFLDRVLTPGFAFRFRNHGRWEKLLSGRSAELLTTMDTPVWIYRFIYGAPGHRAMARATLGYCGVRTVRKRILGPVESSRAQDRRRWLEAAYRRGASLGNGALNRRQRLGARLGAWLAALRLQFYPMTLMAYAVGALLAAGAGTPGAAAAIDWPRFWVGYFCLFSLEAATVFCNELFDFPSDRKNRNHGSFNGGSRVLVEGRLGFGQLRAGIALALGGFALGAVALTATLPDGAALPSLLALAALAVLALGYTAPPLKLSWRGIGEANVALTHSIGVMLCGALFQGGDWRDPALWLVALPLFFAVFPAIVLSQIPDMQADEAAGKYSLPVRLGPRRALRMAIASTLAAGGVALGLSFYPATAAAFGALVWPAAVHALLSSAAVVRALDRPDRWDHLQTELLIALSFILWFVAIPLTRLW